MRKAASSNARPGGQPMHTRWSIFRREETHPYHPPKKPIPPEVKPKYMFRAFQKSQYLYDLETIETRGMYKEEMCIERGKFPKYNRLWIILTDGSMVEQDVEYTVAPFVVMYRDRLSVHKEYEQSLMSAGKLKPRRIWENIEPEGTHKEGQISMVNMMEFPYCVPSKKPPREPVPVEKITD